MTWIEKLRETQPNSVYVKSINTTMACFCPRKFFGEKAPVYGECDSIMCEKCWNREVVEK